MAAALVSALADKPLPKQSVWFGEVSLAGEVRPVSHANIRAKEASKLGFAKHLGPSDTKTGSSSLQFKELEQLAKLVDHVMGNA